MSQDIYLITISPDARGHWEIPDEISLATELPSLQRWQELLTASFPQTQVECTTDTFSVYLADTDNGNHWSWYIGIEPNQPDFQPVKGFIEDAFDVFDSLAEEIGVFALVSGSGEDLIFPRRLCS